MRFAETRKEFSAFYLSPNIKVKAKKAHIICYFRFSRCLHGIYFYVWFLTWFIRYIAFLKSNPLHDNWPLGQSDQENISLRHKTTKKPTKTNTNFCLLFQVIYFGPPGGASNNIKNRGMSLQTYGTEKNTTTKGSHPNSHVLWIGKLGMNEWMNPSTGSNEELRSNNINLICILCPRLGAEWIGRILWLPRAPLGPIFITGLYSVQSIVPTIVLVDLS